MESVFEEKETEVRGKETQLSERHNSVTDAAPLKRIQNSLAALKKEVSKTGVAWRGIASHGVT